MDPKNTEQLIKETVEHTLQNIACIIKDAIDQQTNDIERIIKKTTEEQTKNIKKSIKELIYSSQMERPECEMCAEFRAEAIACLYRKEESWRCNRCVLDSKPCKNQIRGCTYIDIDKKCCKHEVYFCEQRTWCRICMSEVPPGELSAHYDSAHQDITCWNGLAWRPTQTDWMEQWSLVKSVAGTAVCKYTFSNTKFEFRVFIPVSSEQLKEFSCKVRITDLKNGNSQVYELCTEYNEWYDWFFSVNDKEFQAWSGEFDVFVDITKIG